ncbi:hypothetical protein PhCBS80983_g06335 [Powellomyces hirtus]|uniref:Uncharacterized protein n=1 Tax=Powellomyces hirtus TaxID=109895 RepID=A0A507DNT5_9FUNG|nr:hypothetical protein PhCBS80983_g06335 [Powellomyces hirtus]
MREIARKQDEFEAQYPVNEKEDETPHFFELLTEIRVHEFKNVRGDLTVEKAEELILDYEVEYKKNDLSPDLPYDWAVMRLETYVFACENLTQQVRLDEMLLFDKKKKEGMVLRPDHMPAEDNRRGAKEINDPKWLLQAMGLESLDNGANMVHLRNLTTALFKLGYGAPYYVIDQLKNFISRNQVSQENVSTSNEVIRKLVKEGWKYKWALPAIYGWAYNNHFAPIADPEFQKALRKRVKSNVVEAGQVQKQKKNDQKKKKKNDKRKAEAKDEEVIEEDYIFVEATDNDEDQDLQCNHFAPFIDEMVEKLGKNNAKLPINGVIGNFGKKTTRKSFKSVFTQSQTEAVEYYNDLRAEKWGDVAFLRKFHKDFHDFDLFQVTATQNVQTFSTHRPLRKQIIDYANCMLYNFIIDIVGSMKKVVAVKTDCIVVRKKDVYMDNLDKYCIEKIIPLLLQPLNKPNRYQTPLKHSWTREVEFDNSKGLPLAKNLLQILGPQSARIQAPAGYGKLFLLKGVEEELTSQGLKVKILAPTNSAADNADGIPIHKGLCITEDEIARLLKNLPDVVLIDEISQVPGYLWEIIYIYKAKGTCVFLFGDGNQLPPVELGQNFSKDYLNCTAVQTIADDAGGAYKSAKWKKLMEEYNISHSVVYMAYEAERSVETVKSAIGRVLTQRGDKKWIDVLDDLVKMINKQEHRGLLMSPNKAIQHPLAALKNLEQYWSKIKQPEPTVFKVGAHVCTRIDKATFTKGHRRTFSNEVYKITHVFPPADDYHSHRYALEGIQSRVFNYNDIMETDDPVTIVQKKKKPLDRLQKQARKELREMEVTAPLPTRLRSEKTRPNVKGIRPKGTFLHVEI